MPEDLPDDRLRNLQPHGAPPRTSQPNAPTTSNALSVRRQEGGLGTACGVQEAHYATCMCRPRPPNLPRASSALVDLSPSTEAISCQKPPAPPDTCHRRTHRKQGASTSKHIMHSSPKPPRRTQRTKPGPEPALSAPCRVARPAPQWAERQRARTGPATGHGRGGGKRTPKH